MITVREMVETKEAVKIHFQYVWPLIVAGREEPTALEVADVYLGQVESDSALVYRVVMRMIGEATGLSWDAIMRRKPSSLIVARG